jgi:hypothetical protein
LTVADFIALYGLGFLCTVFFLVNGIMLVVTKNINLISKNKKYKEERYFVLLNGWISIVFSTLMAVILVIAMAKKDLTLTMFLLLGIVVITMLLIQFMLERKFREK